MFPNGIKFPPLPVIRVTSSIVPIVAGCIEKRILYIYSAVRMGEIRIAKLQHCVWPIICSINPAFSPRYSLVLSTVVMRCVDFMI